MVVVGRAEMDVGLCLAVVGLRWLEERWLKEERRGKRKGKGEGGGKGEREVAASHKRKQKKQKGG